MSVRHNKWPIERRRVTRYPEPRLLKERCPAPRLHPPSSCGPAGRPIDEDHTWLLAGRAASDRAEISLYCGALDIAQLTYAPRRVFGAQPPIKFDVARRDEVTVDHERSVEHERRTRRQDARGSLQQTEAHRPRRNVNHVNAHHRIRAVERQEGALASTKTGERRFSDELITINADARERALIGVGRLPNELGKDRAKKTACCPEPLATSAPSLAREHVAEDLENCLLVALCGRATRFIVMKTV